MSYGLKPVRLWQLTGSKHFKYMLNRRFEAGKELGRLPHPRHKKDGLKLVAFIFANVIGVAYAFGVFSPPIDCTKKPIIVDEPEESEVCPPQPCPPVEKPKPMPRCPTCNR